MSVAIIVGGDSESIAPLRQRLRAAGYDVRVTRHASKLEGLLTKHDPSVVFLDLDHDDTALEMIEPLASQPALGVVALTSSRKTQVVVDAMDRGAQNVITKPMTAERVDHVLARVKASRRLRREITSLDSQLRGLGRFGSLIGRSQPMQELYDLIAKVGPTDATVLILGETGTGKEVVASSVHEHSDRSEHPFVAVNCGAIPPTLIESELFGHEAGAFTGAANRHRGFFETANRGTLFLDEVTEMPIELQVKLLRVLETRKVRRLGASRWQSVDVRILAASNRDPEEAVAEGELREDLLYRLMIFPLQVPPLRERAGDVELLASYFLEQCNRDSGQSLRLSQDAIDTLESMEWPGNVRELKNVIERAAILAKDRVEPKHLGIRKPRAARKRGGNRPDITVGMSIREAERELILETVRHHGDDKAAAAETLGVCKKTLYSRLRQYRKDGFDA